MKNRRRQEGHSRNKLVDAPETPVVSWRANALARVTPTGWLRSNHGAQKLRTERAFLHWTSRSLRQRKYCAVFDGSESSSSASQ